MNEVLKTWDLEVDPDAIGEFPRSYWGCGNASLSLDISAKACSHPKEMSLEIFLSHSLGAFAGNCYLKSRRPEVLNLREIYGLVVNIRMMSTMSLEDSLGYYPEFAPQELFLPHPLNLSLSQIRSLKLRERARSQPETSAYLLHILATEEYGWNIPQPEDLQNFEDLIYVKPWKDIDKMFPELLQEHYGKINDTLLVIPRSFMRIQTVKEFKANQKSSPSPQAFLKSFPGTKQIFTFGGFLIEEWEALAAEDSPEVRENLGVFAINMSLKDAVISARLI